MSADVDALRRLFGGHQPGLMGARHSYAVLCPLVERADGAHLLFEVRAAGIRQGGEVCFPGGKADSGESAADCALRETGEELSIPRQEITLLGTPDFLCSQRGFLVQPVVGLVSADGMAALRPAPAEVADVFTAPLSFFRACPPEIYSYELLPRVPADFPYDAIGIPESYAFQRGRVEVPVWRYQGHIIWGMTARIVRHLISQ